MEKRTERRVLGRGLSALMSDVNLDPVQPAQPRRPDMTLPVEQLFPNPDQPRRDFEPEALEDLAASLRQKGVIQPLIVRAKGNGFEIVAGERRWRAAQIAQLHEVPVIVREFNDIEVMEIAIIENIQRADLNSIEEALAYRQLMERFGHTQEKVAEALSKSRSHIANLLRLLSLPDEVQGMVRGGKLSSGHARALITTPNPVELAREVVSRGLSVRETEKLVKRAGEERPQRAPRKPRNGEKDADTRALEADLAAGLGMAVSIDHETGTGGGSVTIRYTTLDELDLLCRSLSGVSEA
jgi:ParB family chromosome partitioning protein